MRKKKKRTRRKSRTGHPSSFQTIEPDEKNPEQVEVKEYLVRFNTKFVVVMMILVVACGTGMKFFHDYQVDRKAEYYLDFATSAEEKQDWEKAKRYLNSYHSIRRDDMESLERLGLLRLEHPVHPKELVTAFLNLSEVLRQDPDKLTTRWKIALLGIRIRQPQNTIKHFEYLEAHLDDLPEEVTPLNIQINKGHAFQSMLKGSQAIECYTKALTLDASSIQAYDGLIHLILSEEMKFDDSENNFADIDPRKQKKADKIEVADRLVDKMVELGQPFDEALLLRVRYSLLLRPTETFEKVIPSPSTAIQSAKKILAIYDLDKNEKLDNADIDPNNPEIAWINSNSVPSSADFNRDGILTSDELVEWYQYGERISRLKFALTDLNRILIKEKNHSRALRYSAQLELSLAGEYLSLGKKDVAQGHLKESKKFAINGLNLDHPDLNSYLTLSSLEYLSRSFDTDNAEEHFEKSIDYLRQGIAAAGDDESSSDSAKSNLSTTNDSNAGRSREDILTDRENKNLKKEFHWRLADRLLSSISLQHPAEEDLVTINQEIEKQILWLETRNKQDFLLDYLRGQILLNDQKWREALTFFSKISDRDANLGGLKRQLVSYLSSCYQRLANPDESQRLLSQQLDIDPGWVRGRINLAILLSNSGEYSKALMHFRRISSIPGIPLAIASARFQELIRLPVNARNWKLVSAALDYEEELHENDFDDELIGVVLARVNMFLARASEPIVKNADGSVTGKMTKELFDKAVTILKDGIETFPKESDLRYALIVLDLEHPDKDLVQKLKSAKETLIDARKICGDSIELFQAQAMILRYENLSNAATKITELIDSKTVKDFDINKQVQFANSLINEVNQLKRDRNPDEIDNAQKKLFLHLASLKPNMMFPHTQLVELALRKENDDLFRQQLAELKRIEGSDGPNTLFAEANYDLSVLQKNLTVSNSVKREYSEKELEELSRIKEVFRKVSRLRSQWTEPHRFIGIIEYALGNNINAIDSFERAFFRGSTNETMVYQLINLLKDESLWEQTNTIFREHANRLNEATSPEIKRLGWEVYWNRKMFTEALGLAQKVSEQTNDPRDILIQARMAEVTHVERSDVEDLYRKAIKVALEQPLKNAHAQYIEYVRYLKTMKSVNLAREQIKAAEIELPSDPSWEKQLTLAKCNELIEEFTKAEKYYLQALISDEENPNLLCQLIGFYSRRNNYDNAKIYVDKLIQLDADESKKRWANARLAVLKSSSLNYKNVIEAQDELELNFKDEDKRLPGFLRAKAQILLRKISHSGHLEQIANLEKLNKETRLTTPEAFRLAILYNLVGADEKYEKMINILIESDFRKPIYNAHYARYLITKKEFEKAQIQLLKLESLMPNTLVSVGTRIRFHFANGQKEQGIRVAQVFLEALKIKQNNFQFSGSLDAEQLEQTLVELEKNPALKNPISKERLKKIRLLIEDRRIEAATNFLKELIQQKQLQGWAGNYTVQLISTQLRNFNATAEAKNLFEKYYDFKRDPEGMIFVARLVADDGRIDESLSIAASSEKSCRLETMIDFYSSMIHKTLSKKQFADIESWLKVAYGKQPDSIVLLNTLAEFHVMRGDTVQAASLYRKLLKINPAHIGTLNNLAWILSQDRRTAQEAEILISHAIEMAGPSSELLDTLGVVHLALDNPENAVNDFRKAISEFQEPQYYFHLSLAYFRMSNLAEARENLKIARDRGFSPNSLMPSEMRAFQEMQTRLLK